MRMLGRQAARRNRPHSQQQACPFRGRGRREKLALFARAAPASRGVDAPSFQTQQAQQLVWNGHSQQQAGRHAHAASGAGSNGGAPGRVPLLNGDTHVPAAAPALAHADQEAAVELMRCIKAARSWQQLQNIVDDKLSSMNHLHVSAVVTHMAQLQASSSSSSSSVSVGGGSRRRTAASNGSSSNSVGSFGDLGFEVPLDELLQHLDGGSALHTRHSGVSPGVAAAAHAADPHSRHLDPSGRHSPFHSSAYAAAGGQLQPWQHNSPQPGPQALFPPPQPAGTDPRVAFLQRLEHAVAARLPDFEGRQLANTLWAVAKLGHRPSERWLQLVLTRADDQMASFNPQHLANTLYALMLLRYMPPRSWLEGFYAAASRRLHAFAPGELSHLCYAAGKLGLRPGRELLGGMLHHSMKHMQAYGVRELALLLYGVVHMGASLPADWLRVYRKRVTGHVVESGALPEALLERLAVDGGQGAGQPEVVELARAQLAKRGRQQQQQQQPQQNGADQTLPQHHLQRGQEPGHQHQQHRHAVDARGGGSQRGTEESGAASSSGAAAGSATASSRAVFVASYLPTVLCSLGEVGYRPPPGFMATTLAAVGACAEQLTAVGLTTVLLSLANMRYRPHPALFRRVWDLLMGSLDSLDTQQATIAVWACATLGCAAPRGDVHAVLMNAAARLPEHSDGDLLQLLQAVAALGFEPKTSWLELIESDLYNRLPRMQPQHVAALLLPLAGLRHRPHRLWMTRWAAAMLAAMPELGLAQLAAAAYGAARLGFRPPSRLCAELLAATAAGMAAALEAASAAAAQPPPPQHPHPQPQPHQQLQALRLAQGQEPEPDLGRHAQREQPQTRQRRERPAWARRQGDRSAGGRLPETLSRLLWAVAVLDIRPDEAWFAGFTACLRLVAGEFSDQERSLVVWALARLRHDPGPEWVEDLAVWRQELRRRQQKQQGGSGAGGADGLGAGSGRDVTALVGPPAGHLRSESGSSNRVSVDCDSTAHAVGVPSQSVAGVVEDAGPAADDHGRGALGSSSGSSSSEAGVDMNTLVLQGIWDWAAQQLGETALDASSKQRRTVARGR